MTEHLKRCGTCKEYKDRSSFGKNKSRDDGLDTTCKDCLRMYRQKNREILKERQRQYFRSEQVRAAIKAAQYKYYRSEKGRRMGREKTKRNRQSEKAQAQIKQYYIKNKEYILSQQKTRRQTEYAKELRREEKHRRRAREFDNNGSYTVEQWDTLLAYYDNICLCCGIKGKDTAIGKLTPDHIIPLAKGGSNTIDNIQPLCLPCNTKKNAKIIDYRPHIKNFHTQLRLFD